jgi:acyl-CoA synthetase (AMP-forming)/AMP-acid ligase II
LRRVVYSAAPMPPERVAEARSFFRGKLASVYGQTEMPALMTVLHAEELADDRNLASAGRASPFVRLGIMDPQGKVLGPGDMGEIVARSDMMMTGYLEMPEKTADTIVDGWLHTGDIGYLDERGFLFIKDRLRDVIITGGFNVYPSDVEAALARHPAVYECVVFGVPDTRWGERVEAVVQIHPNRSASAEELIAHVKTLIGSVKAPKLVHVVRELPRSAAGKVLRREAREEVLRLRSEATVETHA